MKGVNMTKAKCKNCGDVLESKYRHNFVTCTCYKQSQDRLYKESDRFIIKSNTISTFCGSVVVHDYDYKAMFADPTYNKIQSEFRGFFLDGGSEYTRTGGNLDDIIWLTEESDSEQA